MISLIDILAVGVTDSAGVAVANGTVAFYDAGTTTLKTVYQDYELTNPHANPATLDTAGRLIAYAENRLKLVIYDSDSALVRTIDNVGFADTDVDVSAITITPGSGLSVDDSGAVAAAVDDTSIAITGGLIGVKTLGVQQSHLAPKTTASPAALGYDGLSSSTGDLAAITATSAVEVTNLSVEKTVGGRPVELKLVPDGTTNPAYVKIDATGSVASIAGLVEFYRDDTLIGAHRLELTLGSSASTQYLAIPPTAFQADDQSVTEGVYTYLVKAYAADTGSRIYFKYCKLKVKET